MNPHQVTRIGPSVLDCLEAAMRADPSLTIEEAIRTVPVSATTMEGDRMTEIIVRPRMGGKTTELIRRAAEAGAYIVCTDTRRAGQVMRLARELGLAIPMPLTACEWQERAYYPPGIPGLMFDDLDRIVRLLSTVPVLAVTWTEGAETRESDGHDG